MYEPYRNFNPTGYYVCRRLPLYSVYNSGPVALHYAWIGQLWLRHSVGLIGRMENLPPFSVSHEYAGVLDGAQDWGFGTS